MTEFWFYILAALTVGAALGVVLMPNPVHSALYLVLTLFFVAIGYVTLGAHLVAALQIIVYTGAVMVLFLFVIMLLNLQADPRETPNFTTKLGATVAGGLVAGLLAMTMYAGATATPKAELVEDFGTTRGVARVLFIDHAVAFELTSVLLLVAVVGAVVLAKKDEA